MPPRYDDNEQPDGLAERLRRMEPIKISANDVRRGLIGAALVLFASIVVTLICFTGLPNRTADLQEGRIPRSRLVADTSVEFVSDILTAEARIKARNAVPPVYRIDLDEFQNFEQAVNDLANAMETRWADLTSKEHQVGRKAAEAILAQTSNLKLLHIPWEASDIQVLALNLPQNHLRPTIEEGLSILRRLQRMGLVEEGRGRIMRTIADAGLREAATYTTRVNSLDDASDILLSELSRTDNTRVVSMALYRILSTGLTQNLVLDTKRTDEARALAEKNVAPVKVQVEEGQLLAEPGRPLSKFDAERLAKYKAETSAIGSLRQLIDDRSLLVLLSFAGLGLYVSRKDRGKWLHSHMKACLITAANVVTQLIIYRIIFELASRSPGSVDFLPMLLPTALAAMLTCLMISPGTAIVSAVIASIFGAMMLGESFFWFLSQLVSAAICTHFTQGTSTRGRLLGAGLAAGLTNGLFGVLFVLMVEQQGFLLATKILASGIATGAISGALVVVLLPVLESVFNTVTDISLLELNNANHPLLRHLQKYAPGTYHHSSMVADLAERAAAEIGANPMGCRVAALYHDIGKLVKPEFFVENQTLGCNPHEQTSPAMSALILKAHVKEGVEIAQSHKLPKLVIDAIRQHHGTTLIEYFHNKALIQSGKGATATTGGVTLDPVNEQTYRYEGPKPNSRETALIFLADPVEAAARTRRKITPQTLDELIDSIFERRMKDGQLSDCPLTFEDLTRIKRSFATTLLSAYHHRIEYPQAPQEEPQPPQTEQSR